MKEMKDLYLVPHDFTKRGDQALAHALKMVREGGGNILLVHIVDHVDEIQLATHKLKQVVEKLTAEEQNVIRVKGVEGNIFEDIAKVAEHTESTAIVMGIHDSTFFQKVFGTRALKVVSSSALPFVLVKDFPREDRLDEIVMPFSFAKESIQIIEFASYLAKKYDATIHLAGYKDSDEWLSRDMKTNEIVIRKQLTQAGVKHDIVALEGGKSYENALLNYAKEINADLIAAAYFSTGIKAMFHSFLEVMIENDHHIPVLTVNAAEMTSVNSTLSFLTV